MQLTLEVSLLIDNADLTPIPDIAEMPFLAAVR
jgi:hypothetical protein